MGAVGNYAEKQRALGSSPTADKTWDELVTDPGVDRPRKPEKDKGQTTFKAGHAKCLDSSPSTSFFILPAFVTIVTP